MANLPKRFACQRCGGCCSSHMAAHSAHDELAFDAISRANECGPIFYSKRLVSGIGLWDSEKEMAEKSAAQIGLKAEILPEIFFFDSNARACVVLSWKMKAPCPFLSGEGCLIYEKRPMVCREWPVVAAEKGYAVSGHCPAVSGEIRQRLAAEKFAPKFFRGQIGALEQDMRAAFNTMRLFEALSCSKKISPISGKRLEDIAGGHCAEKTMGFLEFLEAQGIACSRESIANQLKENLSSEGISGIFESGGGNK